MSDRRVHAENHDYEIVRYDRGGKWFIEYKLGLRPRRHIGVHRAVGLAYSGACKVKLGLSGGKMFDRLYLSLPDWATKEVLKATPSAQEES